MQFQTVARGLQAGMAPPGIAMSLRKELGGVAAGVSFAAEPMISAGLRMKKKLPQEVLSGAPRGITRVKEIQQKKFSQHFSSPRMEQ